MTDHSPNTGIQWTMASRAQQMNPSVIRELLKLTERPGLISFAGGLPSPKTFPVSEFEAACAKVLKDDPSGALQYAASEGYTPLREMIADRLPWKVDPADVMITTGSQQGLDLTAKILIDAGSRVLVESPTYLGAVMAFVPMQPAIACVANKNGGIDMEDLSNKSEGARFFYLLPNFQNPTGRTLSERQRVELTEFSNYRNLPIVEDNPYGDLWFDEPPAASLTSRNPQGCIYLGSFSKILAPGLRLGYMVAPKALYPKLLQAKQAADLHSPSFNQRVAHQVMQNGFLDRHVPLIRTLYKSKRDAMLRALQNNFPNANSGSDDEMSWTTPSGGMFLWVRLPKGMNSVGLLPNAVAEGVAFVPGSPFYAEHPDDRTMRLSFVTASDDDIEAGISKLAKLIC